MQNIVTWKKNRTGNKKCPLEKKRVQADTETNDLLGLSHGNTYKHV